MRIINISRGPLTVKELVLKYKMDGKALSTISHVILTGTVYSPLDKKDLDAAIVQTGGQNIVMMRWNNIRSEISQHKIIEPGGVLSGSAYFILDTKDRAILEKLNELEFVITDFMGRKSTQKTKIEKQWFEKATDAVILNQRFTSGKSGVINFH